MSNSSKILDGDGTECHYWNQREPKEHRNREHTVLTPTCARPSAYMDAATPPECPWWLILTSGCHWEGRHGEAVTCIIISLVSAACSIHSNWEVVVRDGALPGGGGMQDAPWQLWLDVLRWQQNQNHQGKITSRDRGRGAAAAAQKRLSVHKAVDLGRL